MKFPKIRFRTVAWSAVAAAAVLYVAYGAVVYSVQRSILYKLQKPESPLPALPLWLEADGAKIEARWYPAPDSQAMVGIFFHGNAETIDDWPVSVDDWNRHGASVLRVEFPGYGHSTGEGPTEDRIRAVAEAAYDWLLAQGVPAARIFAAGRSLGGGVACDLSTTRPLAGLFLQSSFRSIRDRGTKQYHLPGFLVRDGFENTMALERFPNAVLLMHGTLDQRIPFEDLEILAKAAPQAHAVVFPGYHHSDIPGRDTALYWNAVGQFLADVRDRGGRRSL